MSEREGQEASLRGGEGDVLGKGGEKGRRGWKAAPPFFFAFHHVGIIAHQRMSSP